MTAHAAVKFIRGIVCHFGVPNRIITDNGTRSPFKISKAIAKILALGYALHP
jgi:hypothetical protein